jgi:recombination protein RecA
LAVTKKNDGAVLDSVITRLIGTINKKFGEGAIMDPGSMDYPPIDSISTGSIALDMALIIGGVPRGRVTEIFGPESSGKTTLVNHIIANAQKSNPGKVVWLGDLEHSYDKEYATKCGVDHNSGTFLVTQPRTGEQAFDVAEAIIRSGEVCMIAFDSAEAITPEKIVDGNVGDLHPGARARLIGAGLHKLVPVAAEHNVAIIFTNQLRLKIGAWGNPEITPGGEALKYHSSVRIRIKKAGEIKQGD